MKVKEESEKTGLKLNIQKTKIMASGSITSWQRDGETVETVKRLYFGGLPAVYGVAQSWTRLKRLSSSSRGIAIIHSHQHLILLSYFY